LALAARAAGVEQLLQGDAPHGIGGELEGAVGIAALAQLASDRSCAASDLALRRQQVLGQLTAQIPEYERGGASADPRNLARLATRAEARQPGTLERTFGNMGGGPSFGSMVASSMLGSIAGYVIGSAIADQFFSDHDMGAADGAHDSGDGAHDSGGFDQGGDGGGDFGGGDFDFSDV